MRQIHAWPKSHWTSVVVCLLISGCEVSVPIPAKVAVREPPLVGLVPLDTLVGPLPKASIGSRALVVLTTTTTTISKPQAFIAKSVKAHNAVKSLGAFVSQNRFEVLDTYAQAQAWTRTAEPQGVPPEVLGWWREWDKLLIMREQVSQ